MCRKPANTLLASEAPTVYLAGTPVYGLRSGCNAEEAASELTWRHSDSVVDNANSTSRRMLEIAPGNYDFGGVRIVRVLN
ncbi:hypothetical protein GCM10009610_00610 [Pseudonocardia xinjiangensis]